MRLTIDDDKTLVQELEGLIPNVRDRRKTVVEDWLRIHQAWKGTYNRSFFHSEVFNHYVPYFRRSVERFTVRGAQMVLPTNEFFEVFPVDEGDDEAGKQAESVMQYLLYVMRTRIRMYSVVKQLYRTWALYGRSILKTGVKVVKEDGKQVVWPTARAIDPFMFIMWPETVSDVADAQILVEDRFVTYEQYQDDVSEGRAKEIDRSKITDATWSDLIVRRLQTSGLTEPRTSASEPSAKSETKPAPKTQFVHVSEIWFRVKAGWRFLWIVWNLEGGAQIVRKSTATFARPLYRVSIARELPGEQYTTSMGNDQESLQVLLNDQINMQLEGQATQFAPPAAVDPNLVTRASSLVFRPRAKWLVPPEGVKWMEVKDTTRHTMQGIHWTMGMMDQFGGSSPLAEGQPIRNMPRAGFAVSSLLSMSLSDIRDVARSLEEDILSPFLSDLYALTVQFVPKSQVIKIPRTGNFPGLTTTLKDLEGNFTFNWVGSLQSQDYQDRANRLMTLFGAITKAGQIIMPDLQSRGKQINWTAILKRLWRDGVGERGADSIIEDIPQDLQPVNPVPMGPEGVPPMGPDISQIVKEFGAAGV
jgi:hypothetical protein